MSASANKVHHAEAKRRARLSRIPRADVSIGRLAQNTSAEMSALFDGLTKQAVSMLLGETAISKELVDSLRRSKHFGQKVIEAAVLDVALAKDMSFGAAAGQSDPLSENFEKLSDLLRDDKYHGASRLRSSFCAAANEPQAAPRPSATYRQSIDVAAGAAIENNAVSAYNTITPILVSSPARA